MLFKIPQNIVTTVLSLILGITFFWYALSFSEGASISGSFSVFSFTPNVSQSLIKVFICSLVIFGSYLILLINKGHRLVEGSTLPVFLFSAVGFSAIYFDGMSVFHGISMLLSISSLLIVLKIHNQKSVLGLLFLASLLIGIASVFYYPIIAQLLVIYLTIAFFRPFEVRNYIVTLVGIALPYFYLFCLSYLLDWDLQLSQIELKSLDSLSSLSVETIPILLFMILAGAGASQIAVNRSKFIVRQRNQLVIISIFLIVQFLMLLLLSTRMAWLPMIPFLSVFVLYLYGKIERNWLLDLFLLLIIGSLFWLKF